MLDRLSVPRRALDFEDYIDILRRNVRWLIGPAFAGLVVATVVAYLMEDTFVSRALIRIVPQQISDDLVKNASAQAIEDRINGMAQGILSRATLTNLINVYGLYKTEQKHEPMEDVISKMKDAITIKVAGGVTNVSGRGLPAMEVAFQYRERLLAKKVCEELVTRFMSASSQETLDSQVATNVFLKDEFERTKRELDGLEQQLVDYRTKHAGTLPEQMQTNIQQMSALEQRLNGLQDAATRNAQTRMMLDSSLHIAKDRLASVKSFSPVSQARSDKTSELDRQISDMESTIASLKDRYTDDYPDLQSARDRLAVLKRERDDAMKVNKSAEPAVESPLAARERMDAQAQVDLIEAQIKATLAADQQINRELMVANNGLREYQARVEGSPSGDKEYSDLLRDRDLARTKYAELDAKTHKSNVSMDLERRKEGETLELLDAASQPMEPTAPKRAMIIPLGAVAGLVLGVIIVAFREVKDTSLKNLKDARLYTQLSILGSVPLLENDVVVQRRKQVMLIGWATATVLGLAVMVGSVAHYYMNRA